MEEEKNGGFWSKVANFIKDLAVSSRSPVEANYNTALQIKKDAAEKKLHSPEGYKDRVASNYHSGYNSLNSWDREQFDAKYKEKLEWMDDAQKDQFYKSRVFDDYYSDSADRVKDLGKQMQDYLKNPTKDTSLEELKHKYDMAKRDLDVWNSRFDMDEQQRDIYVSRKIVEDYESNPFYDDAKRASWTDVFFNPFEAIPLEKKNQDVQEAQNYLKEASSGYANDLFEQFLGLDDETKSSLINQYDDLATSMSNAYSEYKDTDWLNLSGTDKLKRLAEFMALNEIGGGTAAVRGLTEDINDTIADNQTFLEKVSNGVAKTVDSFASGILGVAGILYGANHALPAEIMQWIVSGFRDEVEFNKLWNNDIVKYASNLMETNAWNPEEQERLKSLGLSDNAIFNTTEQNNSLLHSNMLYEIVPNIGFTAASMGSSKLLSGAGQFIAKSVGLGARLISGAKNVSSLGRVVQASKAVAKLSDTLNPIIVGTGEGVLNAYSTASETLKNLTEGAYNNFNNRVDRSIEDYVLSNPEGAYNFLLAQGYNLPARTSREGENLPPFTSEDMVELLKLFKNGPAAKQHFGNMHQQQLQKDLQVAQEIATDAGNRDFIGNSIINGAINYTLKATMMAPSVQRRLQKYRNAKPDVLVNKDATKIKGNSKTYGQSVRHGLKEMAGEGLEEYTQHLSSTLGQSVSANSFEQYLDNKYNGNMSTEEARDIDMLNAWGAGIATTVGDMASLDALKEGLYGALGAGIGAPTLQSRYRIDANGNKVKQSPITWHSEFIKGITGKWAREKNEEINKSVKLLKEYFSNPQNREKLMDVTTSLNFMQQMESSAADKDEKEVRDKELGLMVANINMLNSLRGTEYYNTVIETLKARTKLKDSGSEIDEMLRLQPSSKDTPMTRAEAKEAIQKSATKMLDYIDRVDKLSQQISKDYYGLDKDAKDALIYTRLAYEDTKERLKTLRKETGLPSIEGGNTTINNPTLEAIARFGSREEAIRKLTSSKNEAASKIESLKAKIEKLKKDIKNAEGEDKAKLRQQLYESTSNLEQLKMGSASDSRLLERLSKQQESSDAIDSMAEGEMFTEDDILGLDEVTRAALFDRFKNGQLDQETSDKVQRAISKNLEGDISNVNKVIDVGKLAVREREDGIILSAMIARPDLINSIVDAKRREASLNAIRKRGRALEGIILNRTENSTQEYIDAINSIYEDYQSMDEDGQKIINDSVERSIFRVLNIPNATSTVLSELIPTLNKTFPKQLNNVVRKYGGIEGNNALDLELFGNDINAITNSVLEESGILDTEIFEAINAKIFGIIAAAKDSSYNLEELLNNLEKVTNDKENDDIKNILISISKKLEELQSQRQAVQPKPSKKESKEEKKTPKEETPKKEPTNITPDERPIIAEGEVPITEIVEGEPMETEDVPLDNPSIEEQIDKAAQQGSDKPIGTTQAPKQDLTDMGNLQDTSDSLVGNGMMEYSAEDLITYGRQSKRESKSSSDPMDLYFEWMENFGVKLQEIIDNELNEIIKVQPNLRLMIVNDKDNSTKDSNVANRIILCVEYTEEVSKIHNESNGGVFISGGKRYLMVGSLTGKNDREIQKKWARNYAKYQRENGGKQFFEANPSERFYVIPNVYTTVSHMNAGRITRQLLEDEHPLTRSMQEILEDPIRNPEGLRLGDLKWAIIKGGEIATIGITSRDRAVYPIDTKGNTGNTFLMMRAANGIYIPVAIKAVHLNSINNGKLKDRIYGTLQKLLSTKYEERVAACKELSNVIAINEGNNIYTDKDGNIKIVVNGTTIKSININNSDISIRDIFDAIEYWNPRIQITVADLTSESRLKELNDAGALSTDIAKLGTSGADYYVNPIDSNGRPVEVTPPQMPEVVETNNAYVRKKEHSVLYKSKVYRERDGVFYDDGMPVTDEKLIEQLKLNQIIEAHDLVPTEIKGDYEYYIISEDSENPLIYKRNSRTHEVKEFTKKDSKDYLNKKRKEEEAKEREKNAKEALELENIDLGEEESPGTIEDILEEAIKETPKEATEEQEPISHQPAITDNVNLSAGGNSIGELTRESNITTLEGILVSDTYFDAITSIIEEKTSSGEWENFPEDMSKIEDYFKSKGIATTGITNVEEWLNMIRECK